MDYRNARGIDLHIHSTASDGTASPSEILDQAQRLNLGAISITDHDTLEGARQALSHGIPPSLKFLTGVEISAAPPQESVPGGSLHILGYGIRLTDPALNRALRTLQETRRKRNPLILNRLKLLGIRLSPTELRQEAGNGQVGRPHIARLMVKKGLAESIDDAFDRYLGKDRPAYVEKARLDCGEALGIIRNAGGIGVLAHPVLLKASRTALEDLVALLKFRGLGGIEVFYPEHTREDVHHFTALAKRHQLLMTGGTDFHGALKPEIQMGSGTGGFLVPYQCYRNLARNI